MKAVFQELSSEPVPPEDLVILEQLQLAIATTVVRPSSPRPVSVQLRTSSHGVALVFYWIEFINNETEVTHLELLDSGGKAVASLKFGDLESQFVDLTKDSMINHTALFDLTPMIEGGQFDTEEIVEARLRHKRAASATVPVSISESGVVTTQLNAVIEQN